ncbi:hypothetical protein IB260_05720 [Pseudomonas sp. PDM23]|uniref:hypothetical protein n=1 Tax=Pseudomonas sp. PDM23 TaxID=2769275 RepID=UPI00177C406F|nr:hypothetical protein [Pseudomonas sp. PDM23]MBD9574803.1 hypothetical protein [Pseudomonas sp. PDM23]
MTTQKPPSKQPSPEQEAFDEARAKWWFDWALSPPRILLVVLGAWGAWALKDKLLVEPGSALWFAFWMTGVLLVGLLERLFSKIWPMRKYPEADDFLTQLKPSASGLSAIKCVTTTKDADSANNLIGEGWELLGVNSRNDDEGQWTEFVLGNKSAKQSTSLSQDRDQVNG